MLKHVRRGNEQSLLNCVDNIENRTSVTNSLSLIVSESSEVQSFDIVTTQMQSCKVDRFLFVSIRTKIINFFQSC